MRSAGVLGDPAPAEVTAAAGLAAAPPAERLNGQRVARPRSDGMDDQSGAEAGLAEPGEAEPDSHFVPITIKMEGDGPLVLREKVHAARPMTIDQALLEMELVGHDFYLFHDCDCDRFSVVYRRRGYDYGVIRLVEE